MQNTRVSIKHRVGKYFDTTITIENPPVPSMTHPAADVHEYEALLEKQLEPYLKSELPFRAMMKWVFVTSKHTEEQTQHRNNPAFTIHGGMKPPEALRAIVNRMLREYKINLETVEGSGWTVAGITSLEILAVSALHVPVGSGGSWIEAPEELALKQCTINIELPFVNTRCFQRAVTCSLMINVTMDLSNLERAKHYVKNIPRNGKYPPNWEPEYETLGLDFSMMRDGFETNEAQIIAFEEKNPDYGIYIYDRKARMVGKTSGRKSLQPFSCLLRHPPESATTRSS